MKIFLALAGILSFLSLIVFAQAQKPAPAESAAKKISFAQSKDSSAKSKPAVLVELFTSEGCVTCPPADHLLSLLEKNQSSDAAEIITLSLHIDYWNNIGWKDPFSSPIYSQRQEIYKHKFKMNTVYTPQMVVDGAKQFVGSNSDEANKAISESAKLPKADVELALTQNDLKIIISDVPVHSDATVFLAIAEDNLSNKVSGGENHGRTLEHSSVVRDLKPLGRILATDGKFETITNLLLQPDWKKENLKIIIFVQENQSRKILGISKILLDKE